MISWEMMRGKEKRDTMKNEGKMSQKEEDDFENDDHERSGYR